MQRKQQIEKRKLLQGRLANFILFLTGMHGGGNWRRGRLLPRRELQGPLALREPGERRRQRPIPRGPQPGPIQPRGPPTFHPIRRAQPSRPLPTAAHPDPKLALLRNQTLRNALHFFSCKPLRRLIFLQDTKPLGPEPLNANFAEIPWQAMILRDSNRSLLCGGVIIRRDAVLTTAHCVDGLAIKRENETPRLIDSPFSLDTRDILIKGGEWKLGIDEEPLPFQIVKVAVVVRHPDYRPGSLQNDLAVLVLTEKLRFTKNVGSLCLPPPNQIPTQNCIVTGWGKRILQC